jgi:hypothetical protein
MTYTPFLIAPSRTGLDKGIEPWLAPWDAFTVFRNANIKRGIIRKRSGKQLFARFAVAQGLITGITQANPAVVTQVNHGFTTGQQIFLSGIVGMTQLNNRLVTITVLSANTYSLDGVNSTAYSPYVSGGIAWFFQGEPIMGIKTFLRPDGTKQTCFFNTRRMGVYDPAQPMGYIFATGGTYTGGATNRFADYFTGDSSDFFVTENYRSSTTVTNNKLYITNFVDNIYTWDGTTIVAIQPQYGSTVADVVNRCFFIFAFKQRLLLLATEENGTLRAQRARWCQAQNPEIWRDDIPGQGGFVDAPTGEFIVSAGFLKDVLIVQFTNSWWMLRPTSDPALPFRWDKITTDRPVNAPYACLSYDKSVTNLGQGGYVECNGVQVERIDTKLPDFVNEINQVNFKKCYGARYLQEYQTWILYPSEDSQDSDEVLVLNEQEGNFSIYDLPLSCLGFVNNEQDPAWQDYQAFPGDPSANLPPLVWVAQAGEEDFGNQRWLSGYLQSGYPLFLGGSHDGYIYQLDVGTDDLGLPINMELESSNWNPYKEEGVGAQLGYIDFFIDADPVTEITIGFFVNNETAPYKTQVLNFIPQINTVGQILTISNTNPAIVGIHNHSLKTGEIVRLYRIEGMTSLNGGSYTVTYIDDDNFALNIVDATVLPAYLGNGIAVKGEFEGTKIWKRVFAGAIGFGHYVNISNNESDQPINIHAIMPWFRKAGQRMTTL